MANNIKPFEELTLADDFMFYQVMQNDEICIGVLERLLKIEIDHIERQELQKEIKPTGCCTKETGTLSSIRSSKNSLQITLTKTSTYFLKLMNCTNLKFFFLWTVFCPCSCLERQITCKIYFSRRLICSKIWNIHYETHSIFIIDHI